MTQGGHSLDYPVKLGCMEKKGIPLRLTGQATTGPLVAMTGVDPETSYRPRSGLHGWRSGYMSERVTGVLGP